MRSAGANRPAYAMVRQRAALWGYDNEGRKSERLAPSHEFSARHERSVRGEPAFEILAQSECRGSNLEAVFRRAGPGSEPRDPILSRTFVGAERLAPSSFERDDGGVRRKLDGCRGRAVSCDAGSEDSAESCGRWRWVERRRRSRQGSRFYQSSYADPGIPDSRPSHRQA